NGNDTRRRGDARARSSQDAFAMHSYAAAAELDAPDVLQVGGDPNGLAFDRASGALLVADGAHATIVAVRGRFARRVASIDRAGFLGTNLLGGIATSPAGSIFVARHGRGEAAEIFRVDRGAPPRGLGLPPDRWRLGVAHAADEDALYTTEYRKAAD